MALADSFCFQGEILKNSFVCDKIWLGINTEKKLAFQLVF